MTKADIVAKISEKLGMEKGDVVMKLGDSTIVDMMGYMRALSAFESGDETTVEFKRGEEIKTAKVKF